MLEERELTITEKVCGEDGHNGEWRKTRRRGCGVCKEPVFEKCEPNKKEGAFIDIITKRESEIIRQAIKKKYRFQSKIALKFGITTTPINNVCRHKGTFSKELVQRIVDDLGLDLECLR